MIYNDVWQHVMFDSLPKVDFAFEWMKAHPEVTLILQDQKLVDMMKKLFPEHAIFLHQQQNIDVQPLIYPCVLAISVWSTLMGYKRF